MIDATAEQLKIILDILNRCVPHCEVRAFGSRYKGTSKEYSDLPFRVEVLDWHTVSPEFRKVIEMGYEVVNQISLVLSV